jgi:hypothetical protein
VGEVFTLLAVLFDAQKILTLMKPTMSIFSFAAYVFGVTVKKSLLNPMS